MRMAQVPSSNGEAPLPTDRWHAVPSNDPISETRMSQPRPNYTIESATLQPFRSNGQAISETQCAFAPSLPASLPSQRPQRRLGPLEAPIEIHPYPNSTRGPSSRTTHEEGEMFTLVDVLGEGTYGRVHRVVDSHGNSFALKTIKLQQESEGIPSTAIREISLLKELQHPNIIKLYRVFPSKNVLIMVFELADTDLKKYMDLYAQPLSPRRAKSFLQQLLEGVNYIHSKEVIHRDLKPQNLLLSEDGSLRIADFGLSRNFGIPVRPFTNEVVTLWYRPPDALLGNTTYATGLDMWSIGCIFGEMLLGKPLFPGTSRTDQIARIFQVFGTPTEQDLRHCKTSDWKPENFPQYPARSLDDLIPTDDADALDLLKRMLVFDDRDRVSAYSALRHPYFTKHQIIPKVPLCLNLFIARHAQMEAVRRNRSNTTNDSSNRNMTASTTDTLNGPSIDQQSSRTTIE